LTGVTIKAVKNHGPTSRGSTKWGVLIDDEWYTIFQNSGEAAPEKGMSLKEATYKTNEYGHTIMDWTPHESQPGPSGQQMGAAPKPDAYINHGEIILRLMELGEGTTFNILQKRIGVFCKGIELLKAGLAGNLPASEEKSEYIKMMEQLEQDLGSSVVDAIAGTFDVPDWRSVTEKQKVAAILSATKLEWYKKGMGEKKPEESPVGDEPPPNTLDDEIPY
jgi:hypothetical protein